MVRPHHTSRLFLQPQLFTQPTARSVDAAILVTLPSKPRFPVLQVVLLSPKEGWVVTRLCSQGKELHSQDLQVPLLRGEGVYR